MEERKNRKIRYDRSGDARRAELRRDAAERAQYRRENSRTGEPNRMGYARENTRTSEPNRMGAGHRREDTVRERAIRQEIRIEEEERRRYEERRRLRRKRRRQREMIRRAIILGILLLTVFLIFGIWHLIKNRKTEEVQGEVKPYEVKYVTEPPDYTVDLIDVNEYSRPGTELSKVNGIVVHYTGNPGTTAAQNRSYFQNLKDTGEAYASSHFVVGISGEIVQCVPCNEIAYASNDRNGDTIAIECCIPDETGKFTEETYKSLVALTAWLMGRYDLGTDEVIRHYDVTGKECPRYYVKNEGAWEQFKEDLLTYIDTNGIAKYEEIQ